MEKNRLFLLILLLILSSFSIYYLRYSYGVTINGDACFYIKGAQNIADGKGYTMFNPENFKQGTNDFLSPIVDFPPFYSLVLSVPFNFSNQQLLWINIINLLCLVLSALMLYKTIHYLTQNTYLSVVGSLLIYFNYNYLYYAFQGLTEILFLFLLLSSTYFLIRYLNEWERSNSFKWIIFSALFSGLLSVTRYLGLIIIASFYLIIFIYLINNFNRRKLLHFVLYITISLAPFVLWILRNAIVSDNLIFDPRHDGVELKVVSRIIEILNHYIISSWIAIRRMTSWYYAIILASLFLWLYSAIKHTVEKSNKMFMLLYVFTSILYISLVIHAGLNNDSFSPIRGFQRYFIVFFPLNVIFVLISINHFYKKRFFYLVPFLILLISFSYKTVVGFISINNRITNSYSNEIQISSIKNILKGKEIYTNVPYWIYAYYDTPSYRVKNVKDFDEYIKENSFSGIFFFQKSIGVTYHKIGYDSYIEILSDHKYNLLYEDEMFYVVEYSIGESNPKL